ncbi:MAG: GGDEF domain-containing protein, partial [Campylobacterota bacterium]|nr:GGDEF domain-containing protein [Campylobacterota bacterium]
IINEVEEHKNVVSMISRQHAEPRAFSVKINKLDSDRHYYVISFTDITDISIKSKEFEYKASHDALTKIYNRIKLNELFKNEISLVKRYETSLSLIMFDIDHFKLVNDNYGHLVGDKVLIALSSYVQKQIRTTDTFARWGGEEFMILLSHTSLDDAELLAQKLCHGVFTELSFDEIDNISCSFGVTEFKKGDTQDIIFKRVDDALYEAKESGRNCVKLLV